MMPTPARRSRPPRPQETVAAVSGDACLCDPRSVAGGRSPSGRNAADVQFYSTAAPPSDYPGPEPGPASEPTRNPRRGIRSPAQRQRQPAVPRDPARRWPSSPEPAPKPSPTRSPRRRRPSRSSARTYAGSARLYLHLLQARADRRQAHARNIMQMKARTKPHSLYFKFVQPNAGREAIYVAGRATAARSSPTTSGIGKLLAGTLHLDPRGSMAMEDNRHPITEAGIGSLIDTVVEALGRRADPGESRSSIHPDAKVGDRACTMIESIHPASSPASSSTRSSSTSTTSTACRSASRPTTGPGTGRAPELVEEYTYSDLKLNVGLARPRLRPGRTRSIRSAGSDRPASEPARIGDRRVDRHRPARRRILTDRLACRPIPTVAGRSDRPHDPRDRPGPAIADRLSGRRDAGWRRSDLGRGRGLR